jgi:CheY-like chemotaxis protein
MLADERAPAPVEGSRRHVLVVEDSEDNRAMLQDLLEMDGFEVDVAATGPEAVTQALSLRPQIAIVDIGLPLMDGFEVARRVRAVLGGSISLVALTGYGQAEDRQRTAAAGFDAHLTKPVDLAELEAVLRRVCA